MKLMKFVDLSGQVFGRWTVLKRGPNSLSKKSQFFCRCSCGKECLIDSGNLQYGRSTSCKNCQFLSNPDPKFHGYCDSKTYTAYYGMLSRCYKENTRHYHRYGGRGITVCDYWKESFSNFLSDMGEAPLNMQLDRIDNNKGYSKENCRWATREEQMQNREISIRLGEINNGWEVIRKGNAKKKWFIRCVNSKYCSIQKLINSNQVRTLAKCKCNGEKKCQY